jgi:hypothetical protein
MFYLLKKVVKAKVERASKSLSSLMSISICLPLFHHLLNEKRKLHNDKYSGRDEGEEETSDILGVLKSEKSATSQLRFFHQSVSLMLFSVERTGKRDFHWR